MISGIGNIDFSSSLSGKPKVTDDTKDIEKAKESAQEFEAFFLTQMLESMYADMKPDAMFGGGQSEKIFRSFMLDEYGKMMANNGGIGIADNIMNMLLQEQEINKTNSSGEKL